MTRGKMALRRAARGIVRQGGKGNFAILTLAARFLLDLGATLLKLEIRSFTTRRCGCNFLALGVTTFPALGPRGLTWGNRSGNPPRWLIRANRRLVNHRSGGD